MKDSKRLFVGIELPPACKAALRDLNPHLPKLRWMPEAQFHITLSFLGDVECSKTDALKEHLRCVHVPPFFLPLAGVGSFAARGRPSTVWVGVGRGHPHLFALHRHVLDAVLRAAVEPDLKPFHPHVTVARANGISREALQPFLREQRDAEFGMFEVAGFALFSSALASGGATHTAEMRVAF